MSVNNKYNYNPDDFSAKSRQLMDEEKKAIERLRKSHPDLTDDELLQIDEVLKRYARLAIEIALKQEKQEDK